jgi:hypothetical protein
VTTRGRATVTRTSTATNSLIVVRRTLCGFEIIQFHFLCFVKQLNLSQDLDLYEVLYAVDHTLDDHRIVVLDRGTNLLQTQCIEVSALTLRSADAALDLRDFQSCHCLKN